MSVAASFLRAACVRWCLFMTMAVVLHYALEPVHHSYCRRSIFHVMFWKKSQFCASLETVLQTIETMFETAHVHTIKRVTGALDISTLLA